MAYNYVEAPLKRPAVPFSGFRFLQVSDEMVGISLVEVYERAS